METRKTKIWSNNLLQEGLEDTPSNQINQTWPRLQSNMMWGQSLKVHLCLPIFIVKKDTKRSIVLLLRLVSFFTERTLLFFIWYFHKKNGDEPPWITNIQSMRKLIAYPGLNLNDLGRYFRLYWLLHRNSVFPY